MTLQSWNLKTLNSEPGSRFWMNVTRLLRWRNINLTEILNSEFLAPGSKAKFAYCQREKGLWEAPAKNRLPTIKRDITGIFKSSNPQEIST